MKQSQNHPVSIGKTVDQDQRKRLAIIGGGSSGLITLKYALDEMPDWDVVCFEKTNDITGCWGRPPTGFVSTSSKYATQFACFRKFDATLQRTAAEPYADFFVDDEYGRYLAEFAQAFDLDRHIVRNCEVRSVSKSADGRWNLELRRRKNDDPSAASFNFQDQFTHVIVCTGLADRPKPMPQCPLPVVHSVRDAMAVEGKRVVVMGGGESAVDIAQRIAQPGLNNEVFLSLRSGVRVSPRFHPIRGVPSDFLRTRLLLSNHPDVRNKIGQRFVEFRIRFQSILRWLFPADSKSNVDVAEGRSLSIEARCGRRHWDNALTHAARDQLFNVYHNKSDDFLDLVAEEKITIIGANVDQHFRDFYEFQSQQKMAVGPDLIVPAIGYRATLSKMILPEVHLNEFYSGCLHVTDSGLGAVGFARPIIGNIPSISEMQARFVCAVMAGRVLPPADLVNQNAVLREKQRIQFPQLDVENAYPVEMFPYCDQLAKLLDCYPLLQRVGSLRCWWRMMRSPATTLHYLDSELPNATSGTVPIHSPTLVTALLVLAKPIDLAYRVYRRFF